MLCRTSAIIPLKKRSQRGNRDSCTASTVFSLSSGAAAAAVGLLVDETAKESPASPESAKEASSPRRNPFAPIRRQRGSSVDPAVDCPATKCLGFAAPCPLESPVEWTWMIRDSLTSGVASTRKWVRSASLDHSPGALAINGSVASAAAIGAVVPAGVAWCAALSLFAVGAVDKYVDIRVNETLLRSSGMGVSELDTSAAAASPSTLSVLRSRLADEDITYALTSPSTASIPHAFGFALGGAAARYAHKLASLIPRLATMRSSATAAV
jgi:hypothetical protein